MDQKLDNTLNLALDVTEEEREMTSDLNVGYYPETRMWELIIKYSGDIGKIASEIITIDILYGGYAIIRLPESEIQRIATLPEVEFIEKPKRLYFEVMNGKYASCIPAVQSPPLDLNGSGTIVGVVDSGVDYAHPDFRNEDGTTRILQLWDQEKAEIYSADDINRALQANTVAERRAIVPSIDVSGHGTHVLGIAAGNGRASRGQNAGVAPGSSILFVKMGGASSGGFPKTTELMRGIDFLVRSAIDYQRAIAINISFGNSYGSHDGNSLVESYLDNVATIGRTTIVVGTGNEGAKARHASGRLVEGRSQIVEFAVGEATLNLNIQIWKNYVDQFRITLISPSGQRTILSETTTGVYQAVLDSTRLMWIFGEPAPYSVAQEIYLEMIPNASEKYIRSGIWKIVMEPVHIVVGDFNMWMPTGSEGGRDTGFLVSTAEKTLTIPSTAAKVISVGAYDSRTDRLAPFSGRGSADGTQKPDLVAPGVDINSAAVGGGYTLRSGTSMATPFVAGSAALMMQWGIVKGNDPYLYGEKVKAYLHRGARKLPAYQVWPNPEMGYGALCLRESFPI